MSREETSLRSMGVPYSRPRIAPSQRFRSCAGASVLPKTRALAEENELVIGHEKKFGHNEDMDLRFVHGKRTPTTILYLRDPSINGISSIHKCWLGAQLQLQARARAHSAAAYMYAVEFPSLEGAQANVYPAPVSACMIR